MEFSGKFAGYLRCVVDVIDTTGYFFHLCIALLSVLFVYESIFILDERMYIAIVE